MSDGKILAKGNGLYEMMDVSFKKGLSNENSTLEIKNPNDLNSSWVIREK